MSSTEPAAPERADAGHSRPQPAVRPEKPRDIGNGLACASFGSGGAWLSLATVVSGAGFIELTGLPPFEGEWRGDPDAVRRYRSWARRDKHAFLTIDPGHAHLSVRMDAPRGTRGVIQRLSLKAAPSERPSGVSLRVSGRLARPAYAEITEVDPPTHIDDPTRLVAGKGALTVSGEGAPVVIQAWLRQEAADRTEDARRRADVAVEWTVKRRTVPAAVAWVDWPADADEIHVDIACTFDAPPPDPAEAGIEAESPTPSGFVAPETEYPLRVPPRLVRPLGRMTKRAATYARECTALATGPAERTILADHRLLPLSWTRDAYWQARLLLASWGRGSRRDDVRIVADHLRWLFGRCERSRGRWTRSYHADGTIKDPIFQADQQLYPLLELTDYARATGEVPALAAGRGWNELVGTAWAAVEEAIDPATDLIATEENAADDPAEQPYLLADQILLWYTATRLADAAEALGLDRGPLRDRTSRSKRAVDARYPIEGPVGSMWASSVDGAGKHGSYIDANELPIALAPVWGFCRPRDRHWRGTMAFAQHADNRAFVQGPFGGIGSAHTPGTWTLGDIMRWVGAGAAGEHEAADGALQRLVDVAFDDGMLAEAYDPGGSGASVRHWFAWPGAALGVLVLEHARAEG